MNKNIIQKNIHQIWIWNRKIPKNMSCWQNKIISHHTNWNYYFWDDEKIKKEKLKNKEILDVLTNVGEKSDFLRYLVVEKYGWIYLDTDVEMIKSLNTLDTWGKEFFIGEEWAMDWWKILCNAIFWASKNSKILKKIIDKCIENIKTHPELPVYKKTGPLFITNLLKGMRNSIKIYPPEYFSPKKWWEKDVPKNIKLTQNTYLIHHYSGLWINPYKRLWSKIKVYFKNFLYLKYVKWDITIWPKK